MILSKKQIFVLETVIYANETGKRAYLETERFGCKPFHSSTIKSLAKRKLINILETACNDTIFYANITAQGYNLFDVTKEKNIIKVSYKS